LYKCKKSGHVKYDCLNVKKRSWFEKKKKTLKTSTWNVEDDSSTSLKDDGEVKLEELANLCLMVNINITTYEICLNGQWHLKNDEVNKLEPHITFDELQDVLD
jgi:hypothetical protein